MSPLTSFKNSKKIIQALAAFSPMNRWTLKEKTGLAYPRVYESVTRLENNGYVQDFGEERSGRGVIIKVYGLAFKGVLAYLAYIPLHPPSIIGKPGESTETFKNRYVREKKAYLEEVERLARVLESYGGLLDYAIFEQIRWLAERYSLLIYNLVLKIAQPLSLSPSFVGGLKKRKRELEGEREKLQKHPWLSKLMVFSTSDRAKGQIEEVEIDLLAQIDDKLKQVEMEMEIVRKAENELLKQRFAVEFFRTTSILPGKGEMRNETLYALAKELLEKKKHEIAPLEKVVGQFSTGETVNTKRKFLG